MSPEIELIITELDTLVDELDGYSDEAYPYELVQKYADALELFLGEHPQEFFKWLVSQRGKAA